RSALLQKVSLDGEPRQPRGPPGTVPAAGYSRMISAGILRRAMLAVAATGAALACLSLASATVAVVPAAIDLPGGTSVPTPSSTPQVNVPSVSVGPVQT